MKLKILAITVWLMGFLPFYIFNDAEPVIKLIVASLGLLVFVKVAAFLWQVAEGAKVPNLLALVCFFFAWPGVRLDGFQKREKNPMSTTGDRFLESWLAFLIGLCSLLIASLIGRGESTLWNYVALFSFLLIFHLGLVEVMLDGLRLIGFTPKSQFDRPLFATSLRDFWSVRWNVSFIDMNKIFFLKAGRSFLPASARVFLIFIISGVLHEMAISYPVNAGWGLPLLYFVFQGVGFLIEKRFPFPRWLALAWIVLPSPILFHSYFVNTLLGPLGQFLFNTYAALTVNELWMYGCLLGGVFNFCVLGASVQVPKQMRWKEQFALLTPLNRKVMWTYGAYILCIIIFMSGVSFYLSGISPETRGLALWPLFISLFWWARIGIDTLYMKHSDWPQGPLFTIGHVCLSTLFLTLALLYSGLFAISYSQGSL